MTIDHNMTGQSGHGMTYHNYHMTKEHVPYITRSQCLNKLGRAQEAIEDAEVALGNDRWVAEVTGGL